MTRKVDGGPSRFCFFSTDGMAKECVEQLKQVHLSPLGASVPTKANKKGKGKQQQQAVPPCANGGAQQAIEGGPICESLPSSTG